MARPGLDRHVKFRRLCRMLNEPRPHVRGYLELLWDVAYEQADPVIGDAEAVEAAAEYPGAPGTLVAALMQAGGTGRAGFIEEVPEQPGIYQIHDLFDHAPSHVCKPRKQSSQQKQSDRRLPFGGEVETEQKRPRITEQQVHTIYAAYPRKVAKDAALKAIRKALEIEPFERLLEAVEEYARCRRMPGRDPNLTPYPATWFNAGRWQDDRSEWRRPDQSPGRAVNGAAPRTHVDTSKINLEGDRRR